MRTPLIAILLGLMLVASDVPAADAPAALAPGLVNPGYHEQPRWFKQSFLDLREDVEDAAKAGRRVMIYFYQDGCPYCLKLLQSNFGQKAIADKTRRHFDVIAINIFGDREVTDLAGAATTEKAFSRSLRVQFTPTLVVLDEKGATALRLNGYVPPHRFDVALDYAGGRLEAKKPFADYLLERSPAPASGALNPQPWLMPEPLDLARPGGKDRRPVVVLFEQKECAACDEMHADGFTRSDVAGLVSRFHAARVDIASSEKIRTPSGESLSMREWARGIGIHYTPSLVFFEAGGREVFRVEGYVRPFHLASSLDYVASGAYREQPEFQRFVESRAAAQRARGERVDLMK